MSHTSNAPAPKPVQPPGASPETAYKEGVRIALANSHPTYEAAEREFLTRYGDRQLKGFEQGYYDGSCGYAK